MVSSVKEAKIDVNLSVVKNPRSQMPGRILKKSSNGSESLPQDWNIGCHPYNCTTVTGLQS